MGHGLQVWDENGVNLVDTDYRMTQIIGSVYTPDLLAGNAYLNGNIHVPEFATLSGTPFVHHIAYPVFIKERSKQRGDGSKLVWESDNHATDIKIENNHVKWVYPDPQEVPGGNNYKNGKNIVRDYASLIIWGVY